MVKMHEGDEVEKNTEGLDLPDVPLGDKLSGADAYDNLGDPPPFENRASIGRHSLFGGASGVSDLPSKREATRKFYDGVAKPGDEDRRFVQSSMAADLLVPEGLAREGGIISFIDAPSDSLSITRSATRSQSIGSAHLNNFQDDENISISLPSQ